MIPVQMYGQNKMYDVSCADIGQYRMYTTFLVHMYGQCRMYTRCPVQMYGQYRMYTMFPVQMYGRYRKELSDYARREAKKASKKVAKLSKKNSVGEKLKGSNEILIVF